MLTLLQSPYQDAGRSRTEVPQANTPAQTTGGRLGESLAHQA